MPIFNDGEVGFSTASNSLRLSWEHILELFELRPSHKYHVQFVRSMTVSVLALIVNFGVSFTLKDLLGIFYLTAATTSYCAGVIVNYYLSIKWVFALRRVKSKKAEFFIFVVINVLGLILNALIIAAMVQVIKVNYWLALITATSVVFFWNFLARKKILY